MNTFPSAFKLAKVKPLLKKGWKTNISNYWPISLLSILSKVIEQVVHKQTTKFLNDNNIFYKYQSGFRNNHSTDLFLSFLNDKILKGFGNAIYTGMILIDLQKAFDLINQKILFDKLLPTGFSKNTISWYESYLAELHFTVKVVNRASEFANTSAMFNFRSSTVSDLCQWCDPSCRIWLVPICTWFMPAIPS